MHKRCSKVILIKTIAMLGEQYATRSFTFEIVKKHDNLCICSPQSVMLVKLHRNNYHIK